MLDLSLYSQNMSKWKCKSRQDLAPSSHQMFNAPQEKHMVYWSQKRMCTQLNKLLDGKRYNGVLSCFPNEPFPGWTKGAHFLLVNSNLAPRDTPLPNTQSVPMSWYFQGVSSCGWTFLMRPQRKCSLHPWTHCYSLLSAFPAGPALSHQSRSCM